MISRLAAALVSSAILSACSGTVASSVPAPSPHVTLSIAQQAYEADAGMTATNAVRLATLFAIFVNAQIGGAPPVPKKLVCKNGVEQSVTFPTPETVDIIVNVFYDPACKNPFVKSHFTALLLLPTKITLDGKQVTYDPAGAPVAYGKVAGTAHINGSQSSTTVLQGSVSRKPAASPFMSFGLTCTLAAGGSNSCGFGAINSLIAKNTDLGVTAAIDGVIASGTTTDGKIAFRAFAGPSGGLTLEQGRGDAWIVSGGHRVVAQTGRFSETVDATTFSTDISLALRDALADADVTTQLGGVGIGGSVVQRSIAVQAATFETAPSGNGSIFYSDGSRGRIVFFVVLPGHV